MTAILNVNPNKQYADLASDGIAGVERVTPMPLFNYDICKIRRGVAMGNLKYLIPVILYNFTIFLYKLNLQPQK